MENKLYLLRPIDDHDSWEPWYDKAFGFVVSAASELEAREIAATESGDEGSGAWTSSESSTCVVLEPGGSNGVIIRDFQSA